jgi:hypothetical protein
MTTSGLVVFQIKSANAGSITRVRGYIRQGGAPIYSTAWSTPDGTYQTVYVLVPAATDITALGIEFETDASNPGTTPIYVDEIRVWQ